MATVKRTYLTTYKANLSNVPPKNGQVIGIYDADEFCFDLSSSGSSDPNADDVVRRYIHNIKVITSLPDSPQEDILYVYIGNDENRRYLPDGVTPLYDLRVWVEGAWLVVGSNQNDTNVKTDTSTDNFYITGTTDISEGAVGSLVKSADIYATSSANGMVLHTDITGNAHSADTATTAGSAEYDLATPTPHLITSYVNSLSVSPANPTNVGSTITVTLGNGTTQTIKTSDTTYSTFTSSAAGLVGPATNPAQSDATGMLLSGSGWLATSSLPAGKDGAGQTITTTYYKNASFDTTTKVLTLTKGDGTTTTPVSIPYIDSVVSTSADGLAPTAPSTDATKKFLRGDATWATIPDYTGATSGSAGVAGLVPAASSGDTEKFLKSDGTWGSTFTSSADGLVPKTSSANSTDILSAAGSWVVQNSTGSNNDSSNLLYLVGATSQSDSAQTYSNAGTYSYLGKLYSNSLEVVNLSDSQALTNKTYEGYTLGDACSKTISTTLDGSSPATNVPSNSAVRGYVLGVINNKVDVSLVADIYDDTSTSYAVGDYCMYDDGNGFALYKCNTAISSPAGSFDDTKWDSKTITGLETIVTGTLTAGQTSVTLSNSAITTDSLIDIYTDTYGVNPTNITVASGSVTLTFTAQASNLGVKVVIK